MSLDNIGLIIFTASKPQEIIEEMNRRLKENGMSLVRMSIEKNIRKSCKYSSYRLYPALKFLLLKKDLKRINIDEFKCFQKVHGKTYYEEISFNPKFSAILVAKDGTIYRYLA